METVKFAAEYKGQVRLSNSLLGLDDALYFHWKTPIKYLYRIDRLAWHSVVFMLCPDRGLLDVAETKTATASSLAKRTLSVSEGSLMEGMITFHNPYGYLPAEQYGLLPFTVSTLAFNFLYVISIAIYEIQCT